jgi:hypothetical protein
VGIGHHLHEGARIEHHELGPRNRHVFLTRL